MPIKLPKGFQRRKSSGNVLDEVQTPASSSFRVIERPNDSKNFDGGITMRSAGPRQSPFVSRNSFEHDEEDLFSVAHPDANNRGSGGTENSLSTAPYDSAASSTRLSVSTNPSSIDARSDRNVQTFKDIPIPPPSARPGFLRNSARTFSLGLGNKSRQELPDLSSAPPVPPVPQHDHINTRSRAVTASSASTATPPRLFDSDLDLDSSELDGFGNMFDGIGSKQSRDVSPSGRQQQRNFTSSPPTSYPHTSLATSPNFRGSAPRPIRTNRKDEIESSPYSYTSQDSHEGLMRSPSPSKTITQNSPQRPFVKPAAHSPASVKTSIFTRKPIHVERTRPAQEDELNRLPSHTSASSSAHTVSVRSFYDQATLLSPTLSNQQDDVLDPSLAEHAGLAVKYQELKPTVSKIPTNNKIMTPAQFERYKQQHEADRRLGASRDSDSEDEADQYEDEDDLEKEKDKEAAKQRRKQEAHLAVYRQQMMKVTGDQASPRAPSTLSNSTDRLRISSTSDLDNRLSHLTVNTRISGKSSGDDEEEDEDVPLGILAAHGFPNKNRPPTQQLGHSSSYTNLQSAAQSQPPPQSQAGTASVAGENRGSLPVFARQLPQDPYYGAGLVNPSNREAFSIHSASTPNLIHPSGASTAHPLHPSGLVGVIAGEEKARAMRRGSPNAQGNYDLPPSMQHPGMVRSQTMGTIPQAGYPGQMPPMMSPGDHAQIQMSQQMTQMMQMQMQWMQQMSHMMGGQMNGAQNMPPQMPGMPPDGMMPNFLGPPSPAASRPQSIQHHSAPNIGQRAMSTLSPSMANWNAQSNGNYAPSIAPSERSNVGLASRYRPVSTMGDIEPAAAKRSSTFTSSTSRPWSVMDRFAGSGHVKRPSISPVGRKSPLANHQDEDDDEQGWAEMKLKKEKKQKGWKLRKGQNALQELYNGVT